MSYNLPTLSNPGPDENPIVFYNYIPSLALGLVGTILFGLFLLNHIYLTSKFRDTRVIYICIAIGSAWEFVAYLMRTLSYYDPYRGDFFIAQFAITMATPALLASALILAICDTLRDDQEHHVWLPVGVMIIRNVLIGYNIVVAIIIIIGAAFFGTTQAKLAQNISFSFNPDAGWHVLLTGLGNQIGNLTLIQALLTWLIISSLRFRRRVSSSTISPDVISPDCFNKWFLLIAFVTGGMLWTRSIYRLVETSQGIFGPVWSDEVLFGVFEFALIITPVIIWGAFPFARFRRATTTGETTFKERA